MNVKKTLCITAIVVLLCLCVALVLHSGVSDNGDGADGVREQLEQSMDNQSTITAGIGDAGEQAKSVTDSIERSAERIGEIGDAVDNLASSERAAGEIIADSQRILGRIRERGQEKDSTN